MVMFNAVAITSCERGYNTHLSHQHYHYLLPNSWHHLNCPYNTDTICQQTVNYIQGSYIHFNGAFHHQKRPTFMVFQNSSNAFSTCIICTYTIP